ncbi:uncharacterized protein LOC120451517 isoform X1 [Drosophila santomea]|uniref:uncharacterized protein LOC120451517 isoform X1 n=1 Tax=Drosophila santomea TaxID=129105 RepID=UPI001954BCC5|nr:uncharacterized protein LOC120451517 isoform X1 [Drosophila santomea]
MWTNLIYFMLLWGFFCTTQVHGKGKMRDLDVRHVTKFGSYKLWRMQKSHKGIWLQHYNQQMHRVCVQRLRRKSQSFCH